ncbi:MAG: helix-turn-helix domain-containing protein [Oscillospiraceae bacterium]|nr:helix-turn-helix domain-containing protein [Oscillospiraceae bacterium]
MTFGEKLFDLRKSQKFSQEELAEKLGVTRQAVSRWENGETMPDSPNLLEICNLFGVSADYLLRDDITLPKIEAEKTEPKTEKKNKIFLFYIFGIFGMAVLLYAIALSDLDIFYWLAGTVFLAAGIFTSVLYLKGKIPEKTKSPLYLIASVLFFVSAAIGISSGMNYLLLLSLLEIPVGVILLLIYIHN